MIERRAALLAVLGLTSALLACGHPEQSVVDSYFGAVNAQDTQTLNSFAAVDFNKKVQAWKIKQTVEENRTPALLPDLLKKAQDAEKAVNDNKREATNYSLDRITEVDKIREARKKNQPVPGALAAIAAKWDEYNAKDRELRKALAEAKVAVDKEKRNMKRSVGDAEDPETLTGDVVTKKLLLSLTIDGQAKDYHMTLRKYEMQGGEAGKTHRTMSRWTVATLDPA